MASRSSFYGNKTPGIRGVGFVFLLDPCCLMLAWVPMSLLGKLLRMSLD